MASCSDAETQREPNIDDLLAIVTESVEAFKVCKSRIDAVEQALQQALGGADLEHGEPGGAAGATREGQASPSAPGADFPDDDVPF